jgi:uncharacterized membrane protein (UPF0136 family)
MFKKNKQQYLNSYKEIADELKMRISSSFATLIFNIIIGIGLVIAVTTYRVTANTEFVLNGAFAYVVALFVSFAIKDVEQREKVVILPLYKFRSLKDLELFFIIPVIDTVPYRKECSTQNLLWGISEHFLVIAINNHWTGESN